MPPVASRAPLTKTSNFPTYRNTASSSNRTTRTEARPVHRAPAFPSLISRLRVFRVRLLRARRMCISFVGAVVGGRGRGWMSRAGRKLLLARMSPVALLARVLAMQRLVLEMRITFDGVACGPAELNSLGLLSLCIYSETYSFTVPFNLSLSLTI